MERHFRTSTHCSWLPIETTQLRVRAAGPMAVNRSAHWDPLYGRSTTSPACRISCASGASARARRTVALGTPRLSIWVSPSPIMVNDGAAGFAVVKVCQALDPREVTIRYW